ncbi:uncharacterized protein PAC_10482 [Phialocephala subalpina]|uniref:Plastocyanin-like domain-containing protein n=1 Tax=Phialocephala subalpina TaxID=576137 RepID=A0A1L7X6D7_9HELO|nr:uncharacterized protein PAC_10482 [Phialocephala subalpina]
MPPITTLFATLALATNLSLGQNLSCTAGLDGKGYTDFPFAHLTHKPSWQGINGPTIRADVGDLIQILFLDNLTNNYASMHSMGLSYSKENEGSLNPNTTKGGSPTPLPGDAVPRGGCVMWSYHSFVNMASDLNTGLSGPTIVYNPGMMNKTMATHREFVLLYENSNESMSFLASTNAKMYGNATSSTGMPVMLERNYAGNMSFWELQLTNMPTVLLSSTRAPQFYTFNGRVFSNLAPFEVCIDDKAIWYIYALREASYVFHMHSNRFDYHGANMASKSINDGSMMTIQMNATATGIWQVLCYPDGGELPGVAESWMSALCDGFVLDDRRAERGVMGGPRP